jgi:SH3-like domain-containing protein
MMRLLASWALRCWELARTAMPRCAAVLALGLAAGTPALAESAAAERLKITDPYIELRTGPGRGFPIHHVAAREEWIVVELRNTDWYKVRTDTGKQGWVHRSQLQSTLTEAGVQKSFRDIALDDYLARRVQLGAAWGKFKSEPMLKLWTSYKLSETLSAEATIGQVQGVFSGTNIWHLNLMSEPWSDQRLSPFFAIGMGKFHNLPNQTLVNAIAVDAKLSNASIGLRYYLTDRFVVRTDYTLYTAFVGDTRTGEYRAKTIGLSFFF